MSTPRTVIRNGAIRLVVSGAKDDKLTSYDGITKALFCMKGDEAVRVGDTRVPLSVLIAATDCRFCIEERHVPFQLFFGTTVI